jgi:pimeloyl-ACP methyl ester carboxylesterase
MKSTLGFILIPGAGMSDWIWEKVLPKLKYASASIKQRINNNTKEKRLSAKYSDLEENIENIINKTGFDRIILVGHSGAGILAGSIGKRNKKVQHLVFIAANIPENGKTAIEALPKDMQQANIDGLIKQAEYDELPMRTMEVMIKNYFCNTCNENDIEYVLNQKFYPEPICVITEKMNWAKYPHIGKTYIICTEDKTIDIKIQENYAKNLSISDVRRISSDHMVMISHADELADELNSIGELY